MLGPISSSAFNVKLAVMDEDEFLDSFSKKYTNDHNGSMSEWAELICPALNEYN